MFKLICFFLLFVVVLGFSLFVAPVTGTLFITFLQAIPFPFAFLIFSMTYPNSNSACLGEDITFISLNCKGLNNPVKRSKILHYIQHLGALIAFLQETHLKTVDQFKLRGRWIGQAFHSSFSNKTREVSILIHKSIPFIHSSTISDINGRFVIVTGNIFNIPLVLVNIYAPNWDDNSFFKKLFSSLPDRKSVV